MKKLLACILSTEYDGPHPTRNAVQRRSIPVTEKFGHNLKRENTDRDICYTSLLVI